jgi:hypothetical protein
MTVSATQQPFPPLPPFFVPFLAINRPSKFAGQFGLDHEPPIPADSSAFGLALGDVLNISFAVEDCLPRLNEHLDETENHMLVKVVPIPSQQILGFVP